MRLELPLFFSSADPQVRRNIAPFEKPPENQRLLEAIRMKKEMACDGLLDIRDRLRGISYGRAHRTHRIGPARYEPYEHCFPAAESNQAQADARRSERRGRFES